MSVGADRWVGHDGTLHCNRGHPLAAALYNVLAAVCDLHVPQGVYGRHVTSSEPIVFERAVLVVLHGNNCSSRKIRFAWQLQEVVKQITAMLEVLTGCLAAKGAQIKLPASEADTSRDQASHQLLEMHGNMSALQLILAATMYTCSVATGRLNRQQAWDAQRQQHVLTL